MFESVASTITCLIGIECPHSGAGGAAPPGQLIITTVAAGSIALIVSVWNDAIKTYLKGNFSGLLAVTVLIFAALAVPSIWLAAAAFGVLLLSAIFRSRLRGNNLRVGKKTQVPLPKLVLPTACVVYLLGGGTIRLVELFGSAPVVPDRTVAFVAPSKLTKTSLEDQQLALTTELLTSIDLGTKERISDAFTDHDIEFHPSIPHSEHEQFRQAFGKASLANLDKWLSGQEKLNELSSRVDIALEGTARLESATGKDRKLVVRAHVYQRITGKDALDRVTSGNSVVATGTDRNIDELMLVLAVRLAVKLVKELQLPPLTSEQKVQMWSELDSLLKDRMELFLEDSVPEDFQPESEKLAREVLSAADACTTSKCALETAAAFEGILLRPSDGDRQLSTAAAAYGKARGQ
ncbi:hypothetical protein [uncultured Ruegeria sp.]|uniref:hypothetical protein n=1 Tax=uncultured Ruegeria sp. TaxID=259304 RepID=UPI002619A6BC|nr:hypothetical protein [uncultured Ruegeria sp.]